MVLGQENLQIKLCLCPVSLGLVACLGPSH